jgi:GMP synthase (glutamine-hydrolysing)
MAQGMSRDRVKVVAFLFNETEDAMRLERESFLRALRISPAQFVVVGVHGAAPTPAMLNGVDAVIVGGSKLSVWEEIPNGVALADVVKSARAKKIPILGVCFGAQFIAHVFGGKVVRDNAREERGTFEITVTDDSFTDMLFADAPFSFLAQCAHQDCIVAPPPGAVVLASSKACPVQAFTIPGTDVYGVQFHPERSKSDYERANAMRLRSGLMPKEKIDAINATLKETPEAEALLAKFIDRIASGK